MLGREIFLPEQHDVLGIIYHDIDIDDTTESFGQIQSPRKITQWIHLCKG